ncbi:TonB-dependent receptor, partial [bacterium]|nr:TonB-dependent receptor [bacterium]
MQIAQRFLLLTLVLALSKGGLAQQTTGNVEGRLIDAAGSPVAGANVLIAGTSLQGTRGVASADNGHFRLVALPVGKYEVTISHIAYHEATVKEVAIRLGRTTTLGEVTLQPRTIEMSNVTVTATTPAIDPTTHAIGLNIDSVTFENIPTERDYRSILTLVPQANASSLGDGVNISGSTGLENVFYIDGINVTDPNTASASTQLPFNFIKEVQVKTGGYEAEYGRALGGIVNVITHSGSNEFHGSAFGFFTNNRFAGDPKRGFVDFERDNFTQWDGGFSLSGPLVKDRLWFYTAYNHTVEKEDLRLLDVGFFEDKRTANIFAGKLTWKPAPNSSIVFTMLGDPTEHRQVANPAPFFGNPTSLQNVDPFLALRKEGGVTFSLSGQFLMSDKLLLETAISRLQQNNDRDGLTERGRQEPILIDNLSGVWAGGIISIGDDSNVRTAGRLSGTFFLGDHQLKVGVEYE